MDPTIESGERRSLSLKEDSTKYKIRTLYMDGRTMAEISDILSIPTGTLDNAFYLNKYGFRDFMKELKKERFMRLAEKVSNEIMTMDTQDSAKMLAIKQKEAEFVRETLLKDEGYSKRIETIGLNINKNEPLDDEQKRKLDQLLKKAGQAPIDGADVV